MPKGHFIGHSGMSDTDADHEREVCDAPYWLGLTGRSKIDMRHMASPLLFAGAREAQKSIQPRNLAHMMWSRTAMTAQVTHSIVSKGAAHV